MTRGLLRFRYLILTAWTSVFAVVAFKQSHPGGRHVVVTDWDTIRFGSKILMGIEPLSQTGPLHLYAQDPLMPAGPPAALVEGLVQYPARNMSGWVGDWVLLALMIGLGLLTVLAVERLALVRWSPLLALALLAVWGAGFGWQGHIEDAMALTALAWAVVALTRARPLPAGLLIGLAVACKPWALIFLPLPLVLWPRRHDVARALLAAVAVPAVAYLPFLAADPRTTRAGQLLYGVTPGSTLYALGLRGNASSSMRALQVLAGIALVAWLAQRYWPTAIVAGFAVRVLLDPEAWSYYGIGPVVGAVILDTYRRRFPWFTVATMVGEYGVLLLPSTAAGVGRLAWSVSMIAATVVVALRTDPGHNDAAVSGGSLDEVLLHR